MNPESLIDLAIVLLVVLYLLDGYRRGFLLLFLELIGTVLTFYLAWLGADQTGALIARFISLPAGLERLLGFSLLWLLLQGLYVLASTLLYPKIPVTIRNSLPNRLLGLIPSMLKGLVMIAIILTLLVIVPLQNNFRPLILSSQLGRPLVLATQGIQQQFARRYSQELTDTLTFLTTTPIVHKVESPTESVTLHFTTTEVRTDRAAEADMLRLVNRERTTRGLPALGADEALAEVGRAHARDMLKRGYFSHYSPEGRDPFDRIQAAGISYLAAGENLAFAPTTDLAHVGLMNSPKHRDNILYTDFGHVGIGVIDAGIYGKMFVQVFSD